MLENLLITIFYYFFIALIVRLLGKREIAQLGVLDLVIFLIIADVCAIGIENKDFSLAIGITVIAIIEKIFSFLLLKYSPLRNIVDGKENILIKDGEILYENMKKELYTIDDLLSQLRQAEITNISDVKLAILEIDGKLSICKNGEDVLLPVIMCGKIVKENLKYFTKDEEWVKEKAGNIKSVFCAFIIRGELKIFSKKQEKYLSKTKKTK